MKKNIRRILLVLFGGVFLVSGFLLGKELYQGYTENRANQVLADQVAEIRRAQQQQSSSPSKAPDGSGPNIAGDLNDPSAPSNSGDSALDQSAENTMIYPKYADSGLLYMYDALYQQNNDMAGWLYIEGTSIDYPVMHTPGNEEWYIHRGFDKRYASSGSLFIGDGWPEDANYTIIYGHHMKNGTMFASLVNYKTKQYAREHPVIHFDTVTEEQEYEVIAAFYGKVYNVNQTGVFRYYSYTDLSDPEVFDEFMRQVKAAALYTTGVEAEYGDKILTLSTCSYHTDNGRFVVVARCKQAEPGPEPADGGILPDAGEELPEG